MEVKVYTKNNKVLNGVFAGWFVAETIDGVLKEYTFSAEKDSNFSFKVRTQKDNTLNEEMLAKSCANVIAEKCVAMCAKRAMSASNENEQSAELLVNAFTLKDMGISTVPDAFFYDKKNIATTFNKIKEEASSEISKNLEGLAIGYYVDCSISYREKFDKHVEEVIEKHDDKLKATENINNIFSI